MGAMRSGRPRRELNMSDQEREQLQSLANARSMPQGLAIRMKIVLLSDEGQSNKQIANKLGVSMATVCKWRKRFIEQGIEGLHDELRPGRPRTIDDEKVAELLQKTIHEKPDTGTHWTCRDLA